MNTITTPLPSPPNTLGFTPTPKIPQGLPSSLISCKPPPPIWLPSLFFFPPSLRSCLLPVPLLEGDCCFRGGCGGESSSLRGKDGETVLRQLPLFQLLNVHPCTTSLHRQMWNLWNTLYKYERIKTLNGPLCSWQCSSTAQTRITWIRNDIQRMAFKHTFSYSKNKCKHFYVAAQDLLRRSTQARSHTHSSWVQLVPTVHILNTVFTRS